MNIVHVCIGGPFSEKYAYQDNLLPEYQRRLGHKLTIIAPTYSEFDKKTGKLKCEQVGESFLKSGIRLIRLKPCLPDSINSHIHVFYGLGKAINKIDPDLIYVHGVFSLNYRFFYGYKKSHPNVRIVCDNHADFNNSCKTKASYIYCKYIARNFVTKKLVKISDTFYGVTPARCDFLHEMFGVPVNKISLLPLGASDDDMHIENKEIIRQRVRNEYHIEDKDFLIVTGGKIDPIKNIHILAEAVSRSKYDNLKILIFGSIREDLKETFDRLKSDRIQYIGWVPSNEVYRYFYAADAVVFPGLHSVLWEQAVASQVPCAFSKIKGFEHVDIGGNCIFLEQKTVEYYQGIVEKFYTDNVLYNTMKEKAQSDKSKQFLYSRIAKKVLDDLKNV